MTNAPLVQMEKFTAVSKDNDIKMDSVGPESPQPKVRIINELTPYN